MAYTPQHRLLSERAAGAGVSLDARAPVHSDEFKRRCREEADCLLLPQSLESRDLPLVSTAFPSKWADYATLGLPVVVWAPPQSSSARFVSEHPGCAALVTSSDPGELAPIFEQMERAPDYRRDLAERLLETGRTAFSPQAAWQTFEARSPTRRTRWHHHERGHADGGDPDLQPAHGSLRARVGFVAAADRADKRVGPARRRQQLESAVDRPPRHLLASARPHPCREDTRQDARDQVGVRDDAHRAGDVLG
jgi:hypothetical protein